MTTERPDRSGTDSTLADTSPAGTIEGGPAIIRDAQSAKSDTAARARERADVSGAAVRDGSPKVTGTAGKVAAAAQQSIPAPVRHTAGRLTTRARRLTWHAAAWARQNPKAVASAVASAAAAGLAACRRITRRGQR